MSVEKVMDKFDCVKYLENYEEIKLLKKILFTDEQNIIINELANQKKEMDFEGKININDDFLYAIKTIGPRKEMKNLKLKRILKKIDLI